MSNTISFTPVYDRCTQKSGILVDREFLDQIKLDLYEKQKTSLTALEMLDWLKACVNQAETNRKNR
jgi:hypothetical protein